MLKMRSMPSVFAAKRTVAMRLPSLTARTSGFWAGSGWLISAAITGQRSASVKSSERRTAISPCRPMSIDCSRCWKCSMSSRPMTTPANLPPL